MGFRQWLNRLYDLFHDGASIQTTTMTEEEWVKEEAERRFQEEMRKGNGTNSASNLD